MKKVTALLTAVALLVGNTVQAQDRMGQGASSAQNSGSDSFAWGVGLAGVAVIAVVAGVAAGAGASTPSSFGH